MKVISINVGGIEQAVKAGLYQWIEEQDADVVCIQDLQAKEYQLSDDVLYPSGYNAYFFDGEPENYSGVAVLTKDMPKAIMMGLAFEACDRFGRYLQADFDKISIGSLLMPTVDDHNQLNDKIAFQKQFVEHLKKTRRKRREFIFCVSGYVAHKTVDVSDWESQQNEPGFLMEERAFLDQALGPIEFVDAFREANFGENQFTYWPTEEDRRRNNPGWRYDYQLCTPNLKHYVVEAKIEKDTTFSDHAPVIIEYEVEEDEDFGGY